jgi:hypothetical protein
MSDNDRPELRAYRELETLVRNLGDELAAFRKRAISAESQLKDVRFLRQQLQSQPTGAGRS